MHNFHVPLPEEIYTQLKMEASRSRCHATKLAREAIEKFLVEKQKMEIHHAIVQFATENAGSEFDLDEELEEASIEHLNSENKDIL